MTYDSWRFNDMSQGVLAVPLWIPQLGYSAGLVILLIAFVDEFVHVLRGNEPRYEKPKPQTAEEVVERAIQSGSERMALIDISILLVILLVALLAGGVWIAHRADGLPAGSACSSSAAAFRPARCWRRRSGATARRGRWPRCRCSSGWARSCSARSCRKRCSAASRRGSTGFPGRLMHVNVLACGIFGSVSGSSAATCATVAKIALPELKKRGYDEMVSLGSLAGAGTLGILIPPSITMVVYAVQANVSIIQVFLAGFLPGLLVMALYSGYIVVWSLLNPEKHAAARAADAVPREAARVRASSSRCCC